MSIAKKIVSDIDTVEITVGALKFLQTFAGHAAIQAMDVDNYLAQIATHGSIPYSAENAEARAAVLNAIDLMERIRDEIERLIPQEES